jgi:hypothetical protein
MITASFSAINRAIGGFSAEQLRLRGNRYV